MGEGKLDSGGPCPPHPAPTPCPCAVRNLCNATGGRLGPSPQPGSGVAATAQPGAGTPLPDLGPWLERLPATPGPNAL